MTDPVEKMARAMILGCKGDPDMLVQPGTPQVYGTPMGDVFAVTPGAQVPLWTNYTGVARAALELAKEIQANA